MKFHQLLLLLFALSACSEEPKRAAWAVVVSIAPHPNPKFDADEVVVTARSQDGLIGMKRVLIARLNCHVGDTVAASAQGTALKLVKSACER